MDNLFGAPTHGWFFLVRRFSAFLSNLELTPNQLADGWAKQGRVREALNRHYWQTESDQANGVVLGSWGKALQVRPPRDVDLLFVLPLSEYQRFEQRVGNKQSQLLQDVRAVLVITHPPCGRWGSLIQAADGANRS